MNRILVIARKDIREALRSRSTYIFVLIMLFVTFSYVSSYSARVRTLTSQDAIIAFSRIFMTSLAYALPLMYSVFVCSIFATYSVVVDKTKRNLESLMATPVSIIEVWMGKTLAVTLPSVMIGLIIAVVGYGILSFAFVMPLTHVFIFPEALSIFSAIVIVPVLVFSIVSIVTAVQLTISNPRIANIVFTLTFVFLLLAINLIGALGISNSYFPLVYLGLIILCCVGAFALSRSLKKEKVILSSKS
jgi:ABC-type Na+ efflux pump permease subunit